MNTLNPMMGGVYNNLFFFWKKGQKGSKCRPLWPPKSPSKNYIVGGIMSATSHNPVEDFIYSVGTQRIKGSTCYKRD